MIEVKGISKSFGEKKVLDNLSFSFSEGETVGIYGRSGIGKTTLARILSGLTLPDSGEVWFSGKLLLSKERGYDRALGSSIQMVYQHPYASLDPNQKIKDSLVELIKYHNMAKGKDEIDTLIEETLSSVNLSLSVLSHLPRQISGGEAQRVALARCLLMNPKLLIMDEATSMLDVMVQANVFKEVQSTVIEKGGSVMLISHDRELVDFLSDRMLSLNDN